MRPGEAADDTTLLIRAAPGLIDEAVVDVAEAALDSADTYEVERPDGLRVLLYGVSVFALAPGADEGELLRRFASSPYYLEASARQVRAAGFEVMPTGANRAHFDVLLIDGQSASQPLLSMGEVHAAARRLVEACGDIRPNRSYAGGSHD
ncbi:MAG TPA: hypothetical protein VM142_09100 [Acidimicrobiales bacterium]|nr:hypothetical protein [Acidimicrobiales bacterium]